MPVTNGIIEAAKAKHAADNNYKCRILLTSGENLKEAALPDSPNFYWKGFVSLQYFAGNTASVKLDPNISPDQDLIGAQTWQPPQPGSTSQLVNMFNSTQGAQRCLETRT